MENISFGFYHEISELSIGFAKLMTDFIIDLKI
jgi:hypothetical protein